MENKVRLLEADDLKAKIEDHRQPTDQKYKSDRQWAVGYNAGLDRALHNIAYARSVDAALVVHGRWEEVQYLRWIYARCPLCGTRHDTKTNYCPNCGARMDLED